MAMDGTPIIIKKKKAAHAAHHGGSWKVAYADFVTAMMAFFLTLWIMGLSDSTRTQVSGYFNDPLGFTKTPPLSRNIMNFHALESPKPGESKAPGSQQNTGANDVQSEVSKVANQSKNKNGLGKQVTVTWGNDGTRIEFAESAKTQFFELGSPELTPEAAAFVEAVAAKLHPTVAKFQQTVTVEGYTDAKPFGGTYDNYDLSALRALSLKHEMQKGGFKGKQFSGVVGYGDQRLKIPDKPYAVENRRVTIWLHTGGISDSLKSISDTDIRKSLGPEPVNLLPDKPSIAHEDQQKS